MKNIVVVIIGMVLSWYPMVVLHEIGHIIASSINGADIHRIDLLPWQLSMTIRSNSSYPVIDVYAGFISGFGIPAMLLAFFRFKVWWLSFFIGFCFLANGVYLFSGIIEPFGDMKEFHDLGQTLWPSALVGMFMVVFGLMIWYKSLNIREIDN